ncbi:MAG: hypothetical protein AB9882_12355 [Ignavibacteriaceae bacterium]
MQLTSNQGRIFISFLLLSVFLISGCSSSVDNRYKHGEVSTKNQDVSLHQDTTRFDLSPYKTTLPISRERKDPVVKIVSESRHDGIWTNYPETQAPASLLRAYGYRVQLAETEDFDEAENIRTDLYFKTVARRIYIDFDSPFYKVKIGDFTNSFDAKEYSFRLSQLGFKNTTIVKDSINIYK